MESGMLSSGSKWELVESRRNAVEGHGKHFVLYFIGGQDVSEIPLADQKEALALAMSIAHEKSKTICEGRWRILLNGPKAAARDNFHVHILCIEENVEVTRLTDSIIKPNPV